MLTALDDGHVTEPGDRFSTLIAQLDAAHCDVVPRLHAA